MSANQPASFFSRLADAGITKDLTHIAGDLVRTLGLLAALTIVHLCLKYVKASQEFLSLFLSVHEWSLIGTYVLLVLKGFLRLLRA